MVKLIRPSYEILTSLSRDDLKRIEIAGRTCYKSEDKITDDSSTKFVKMIVKNGHLSVIEHLYVTVKFISNRGFTHEVVRHRMTDLSQESTRYCDYTGGRFGGEITIIDNRPWIIDELACDEMKRSIPPPYNNSDESSVELAIEYIEHHAERGCEKCQNTIDSMRDFVDNCKSFERYYFKQRGRGLSPNISRGGLGHDLKAEIVVTANVREWLHIFEQRCSPAAHPNMREIMIPLREEFRAVWPEIFGELGTVGLSAEERINLALDMLDKDEELTQDKLEELHTILSNMVLMK